MLLRRLLLCILVLASLNGWSQDSTTTITRIGFPIHWDIGTSVVPLIAPLGYRGFGLPFSVSLHPHPRLTTRLLGYYQDCFYNEKAIFGKNTGDNNVTFERNKLLQVSVELGMVLTRDLGRQDYWRVLLCFLYTQFDNKYVAKIDNAPYQPDTYHVPIDYEGYNWTVNAGVAYLTPLAPGSRISVEMLLNVWIINSPKGTATSNFNFSTHSLKDFNPIIMYFQSPFELRLHYAIH
ncbi:MAG: hypothetical protein AAF734_04875 [Bacteroidota bacterium]